MAEKYWSEQPCSNYHGIQSCSRKFCGNSVVEQGEEWRNMTEDPLNFVTVTPVVCLAVFWSLEFTVYWAMLYCVPHPSCLWALCGEYRRMNVISQSGAVELHVSILRMCLFRMGPREGLLATAMKKKRCKYDDQWWELGVHLAVATGKSTLMLIILVTVESWTIHIWDVIAQTSSVRVQCEKVTDLFFLRSHHTEHWTYVNGVTC